MDQKNEETKSPPVAGISFVLQSPSKPKTSHASPPLPHCGLRPYRQTCSVRSLYEEAAVKYASAARTTALFPLAPTFSATLPNSITRTATENQQRNCLSERLSEQEDCIGQGFSGMRYDFVPSMQDSKRSTTTDTILPKPKEIGVRKTLPVRRGTSCVAVPKQARLLFRNSLQNRDEEMENHKSDTVLHGEEIHVEEEFPSRYSFLFHRLDANGHHIPVPVTIISPLQPKPPLSNSCTPEFMTRDNLLGHAAATNEKHQISTKNTIPWQITPPFFSRQLVKKGSSQENMETGDLTPSIITSEQLSDNESLLAKETFNRIQHCSDIFETIFDNHSNTMETEIEDKSCNCDSPIREVHMDNDIQVVFDKYRRDEVPNFIILSSDSSPDMESFSEHSHLNDRIVYEDNEKATYNFQISENECLADLPDLTHSVLPRGCTPSNLEGSINRRGVSLTSKDTKDARCSQNDDETDSLASTIIFDPVFENITEDLSKPEKECMMNHKQIINNNAKTVCPTSQQNSRNELECESFLLGRHEKNEYRLLQSSPSFSLNTSVGMERADPRSENVTFTDVTDGCSMKGALDEDLQRKEDSKMITIKPPVSARIFKRSQSLKVDYKIYPDVLQAKTRNNYKLADSLSVVGVSHGNMPIYTPSFYEATSGPVSVTCDITRSKEKVGVPDSCKFSDPLGTLFISDGDLILPIHTQVGVIVDFVDVVQMLHGYKDCAGKKENKKINQQNMNDIYITINIDVQGNNWQKGAFDGAEVSAILEKLPVEEKKQLHRNQCIENITLYQKDAIGSGYHAMVNQTEIIRNQVNLTVDQKCGCVDTVSIMRNMQGQCVENVSNHRYFDTPKEKNSFWQEGMNLGIMANEEMMASSTAHLEQSFRENSINQNDPSSHNAFADRQIETVGRNVMGNDKVINISAIASKEDIKISQDLDCCQTNIINRADTYQEVIMNSRDISQNSIVNNSTKVHEYVEHKNGVSQESALNILGEEHVTDRINTCFRDEDHKNTKRQRTLICKKNIVNQELGGKQETRTINILNTEKQTNIESILLKQNSMVNIENKDMKKKANGNHEVMINRREENIICKTVNQNMVLNNNSIIHDRVALRNVCKIKTESNDGNFISGLFEMNNETDIEFSHPKSTSAISNESELQNPDFIFSEHDREHNDLIASDKGHSDFTASEYDKEHNDFIVSEHDKELNDFIASEHDKENNDFTARVHGKEHDFIASDKEHNDFAASEHDKKHNDFIASDKEHNDFTASEHDKEHNNFTASEHDKEHNDFIASNEEHNKFTASEHDKEHIDFITSHKEHNDFIASEHDREHNCFVVAEHDKEHNDFIASDKEYNDFIAREHDKKQTDFTTSEHDKEQNDCTASDKEHNDFIAREHGKEHNFIASDKEHNDFTASEHDKEHNNFTASEHDKEHNDFIASNEEHNNFTASEHDKEHIDFITSYKENNDFTALEHDREHNCFVVVEHEEEKILANVEEIQDGLFKSSRSTLDETSYGLTHYKEVCSNDILTNTKELLSCLTINEPSDNCQLGFFHCVNSEKTATDNVIDQGTWLTQYQLKGPLTLDGTISNSHLPIWKQKYLGTVQDIINETFMIYNMKEGKLHQEVEELTVNDHEVKCNIRTLLDTDICKYKHLQSCQDPIAKKGKVKVGRGQIRKENPCQDNGPYFGSDMNFKREEKAVYTVGKKSEDMGEMSVAQGIIKQNDGKSWKLTSTTCHSPSDATEDINGSLFLERLSCSDNIKIISNNSEKSQKSEPMRELPMDFLLRISQKIDQLKGKPKRTQYKPLKNKRQHDFNDKLEKFIKKYHNTKHKSSESPLEAKEKCPLLIHQEPDNRKEQTCEPPEDSQGSKHEKRAEEKVGGKEGNIRRKVKSFKEGAPQGRKNMNKNVDNTFKRIEAPLDELHTRFLRELQAEGEVLLSSLKGEGEAAVIGSHQHFSTLQPDHTRFLLNQLLRMRDSNYGRKEDRLYRKLLMLHGLVKAANLLMHYGICSATQCLREFQNTHPVLMPEGYVMILARLEQLLEGVCDMTHPKVKVVMEEMAQVRQQTDPWDADLKILILTRRQNSAVTQQLKRHLGHDAVYCLESSPNYRDVLLVLETYSVVVCEEWSGLQDLPYSQFGIVFQWEADGDPSPCVSHCVRQSIQVVALSTILPRPTVTRTKQELKSEEETSSSCEKVSKGRYETIKYVNERRDMERKTTKKGVDPFTFIASSRLINNAELHYILTSVFNIFLVERSLRDLVDGEECKRGWADLVVDERTCILLQPLAHLRTDSHVHYLTKQLVLLSLQCATCYLILYSDPRLDFGYIFRSNVVKALTRLAAACAQFRSLDYTVSICLASSLEQAGQLVREVAEASRAASTTWDQEDWTSRPWLTHHMSSHERFLLALPCTNSITSQVILTAVSLSKLLTSPVTSLLSSLPWLPHKIIAMLHKLLHGDEENLESTINKNAEIPALVMTSGQDGPFLHGHQGSSGVAVSSHSGDIPLQNALTTCITQHNTTKKGMAVNNHFGKNAWGVACQSIQQSHFDDKQLTSQRPAHYQVLQSFQQEYPFHQEYSVPVVPQQKQPPQCLQLSQQYSVQHMQNVNLMQRKDSETQTNTLGGRSEEQSGWLHFAENAPTFPSPYLNQLPGACFLTASAANSLHCKDNFLGVVDCNEGRSIITENSTYMNSPEHEYWRQHCNAKPKTSGQQTSHPYIPSVPPSPRVILRQLGRRHHFPTEYNPSSPESAGPPCVKKLAYQMVSGMGGQTKLVFKNA